jgi:flavin-binding protein dodecin
MTLAKVIEIIGSSQNGWEEAAQVAIDEAKRTIHGQYTGYMD